jgi:DNA polymerase V
MFALIDGNSFYCSCERAFDPKLRGKPVVVLSNNDGCAIARTHEAKDLGVAMGEPYHLARKRPELKSVIWKSSNYALYGDMSRRMSMRVRT